MCLEDRFLFSLYKEQGFVPLKAMADAISITENALLSIIHRVQTTYPAYLVLQHAAPGSGAMVSPNTPVKNEVKLFLADGGFTAINEQELREYYETEMEAYTRFQKMKRTIERYGWIKWTAGTVLTIGTGILLHILLHKKEKR